MRLTPPILASALSLPKRRDAPPAMSAPSSRISMTKRQNRDACPCSQCGSVGGAADEKLGACKQRLSRRRLAIEHADAPAFRSGAEKGFARTVSGDRLRKSCHAPIQRA